MSSAKWGKAAGRFEAADTEEELIAALGDVLEALETEDGLTETVEKRTIIKMALEKKRSVPKTVWTKSVMAAYSKILHAYSQPVVPKAAYEGQQFPPAYLFTAPQIDAPESGDDPADSQFAGNFVYKPPSDMKSDIDDAPSFVPLVPSGGQQQSSSPSAPAAAKDDWGDVPPPPKVNVGPPPPPLPSALHKAEAITEYTIDCVNGEEDTTDVWCAAGEAERVTHLNLYHNNVLRIERLEKFPCLLRLTLRSNNLNTLAGVHRAFYLRWLDASVNNLENLVGVEHMQSLEWVDLSVNNLPDLQGLRFCPNVTFLNLHHNNLTTTADIHNFPNLRWVNMSSNNLKEVNEDLCKCRNLVEVDLAYNNLRNPKSIMQLADLPHLRRLDLSQNDFSESDKNRILSFFRPRNPQCKVVFTSELTGVAAEEAAQESGGGSCCAVQ